MRIGIFQHEGIEGPQEKDRIDQSGFLKRLGFRKSEDNYEIHSGNRLHRTFITCRVS